MTSKKNYDPVVSPKGADRIANSVDPQVTAL